jgi:hypothetical protein
MENNNKHTISKAHLITLNLNSFKMIEALGIKIIALRSHLMALTLYKIS